MTATDSNRAILRALWARHCEDIADSEVNVPNRQGHGVTSQRMDFVAIAASWARPRVICYEVKVDRRDFVHDTKWQAYLPTCHELVFVTKQGVATKAEIPELAGWQELLATGGLVTRKKAPRRVLTTDVEVTLYKHLLMRKCGKGILPSREFFESWLKTKREERALGRMVGRELAVTVAHRLAASKVEAKRLADRCDALEGVRETLKALGITNPDEWALRTYDKERDLKRRIHAQGMATALADAPQLAIELKRAAQQLEKTAADITKAATDAAAEANALPPPVPA